MNYHALQNKSQILKMKMTPQFQMITDDFSHRQCNSLLKECLPFISSKTAVVERIFNKQCLINMFLSFTPLCPVHGFFYLFGMQSNTLTSCHERKWHRRHVSWQGITSDYTVHFQLEDKVRLLSPTLQNYACDSQFQKYIIF